MYNGERESPAARKAVPKTIEVAIGTVPHSSQNTYAEPWVTTLGSTP